MLELIERLEAFGCSTPLALMDEGTMVVSISGRMSMTPSLHLVTFRESALWVNSSASLPDPLRDYF